MKLHTDLGFREVGIYRSVGYKNGAWHDVIWMHRALGPRLPDPPIPLTLREVQALGGWETALAAGVPLLRNEKGVMAQACS